MTTAASGVGAGVDVRPSPLHLVAPDLAARVAAPAHDALSAEERRRLLADNPDSFLHVYEDARNGGSAAGRARLDMLLSDGVFAPVGDPALALYRLRLGDHTQVGVVGDVPVDAYERGLVRPHEATVRDKELALADTREVLAMTSSPVFLGVDATADLGRLVAEGTAGAPTLAFTAPDGVEHTIWVVDDPHMIAGLRAALADAGALYIIDGHHRCAAAAQHAAATGAGEGDDQPATFLAVLFPLADLRLSSYHRCVARPAASAEALLARLREHVDVEPLGPGPAERARPDAPGSFGLLVDGDWYRLRPRPGSMPADLPDALDASVLQRLVLGPVLGVADPRDGAVDNVPGTVDLDTLAARCAATGGIAFVQHPASLAQLRAVADAGAVMPPKTTYFEPKAGAGVFLRLH